MIYVYVLLLISILGVLYFTQRTLERRIYLRIAQTNIFCAANKLYLRVDMIADNDNQHVRNVDLSKLQVVAFDQRTAALRYVGDVDFYIVNDRKFMVQTLLSLNPKESQAISIVFNLNEEYQSLNEGYELELKEGYLHIYNTGVAV